MGDNLNMPDNLEFTQQDIDTTLGQDLPTTPTDLDYDIMFKEFSDAANSISYHSDYEPLNSNYSGPVGFNYNPYEQNVNLSNSEINILKNMNQINDKVLKNPKPLHPIYTNKRITNFERYYSHDKFGELGWHPYRDNEKIYNENSTVWDDYGRMLGQMPKLLYTGFVSAYRSIGDLFDDDPYLFGGKDLDSAREFSDAMRIGNSTRGGVGEFMNNLVLQFGYTGGIILNIAAEEFILSGLTRGGSIFTAPARVLQKTATSAARATRIKEGIELLGSTVSKLKNIENSKGFYQALRTGDSKLMKFLLPETMGARRLITSTNGMKNLSDFGKTMKTYGGFYRDLRSLNYAISEAKMEGGMVYDERMVNGLASRSEDSTLEYLPDEDLELIRNGANESAYYTTLLNAPFIYFTNQFILGNALGSSNRSLAKLIADNSDSVAKKLIRQSPLKKTFLGKPILDDAGKVLVKQSGAKGVKGFTAKGLAIGTAGVALRYFSQNFGEGVQEVYQEAVSHGVGHYYDAIIKDPTLNTRNLFAASLSEGMSSQFSEQGFKTFLSGFMMGGIAGPVQSFLFNHIPNAKNYLFNREEFLAKKKEFKQYIDKLENQYNSSYTKFKEDPDKFLDLKVVNTIMQRQVSQAMNETVVDNDNYEKINQRDISKFQNLYTLANNGSLDMFRDQLNDYLKLSDEDIATAFPSLKSEVKTGKIKERLNSYIEQIDKVEELYNKNKNKNINPFDPSQYDPLKEPGLFQEESFRYKTFEHIRYLAMFTENSMIRAGERMISLYKSLEVDPVFKNMAANDLVLLTQDRLISDEINNLKAEIKLAEDTDTKYEGLNLKKRKLKNLQKIQEFLKGGRNKFGSIKLEKKEQIRKLFKKYVQDLATDKQSILNTDILDEQIDKIFDYNKLSEDEKMYNNSIIALSDPTKFDELFTATYKKRKEIYDNGVKIFRDSIYKHINNEIYRKILNDLADMGYYLDPQEVIAFHESGYKDFSLITKIYDEKGIVEDVNIEKTLKKLLDDAMLKEEQEEETEDDNKAIIDEEIKLLMEEFELDSYTIATPEQDQQITNLEKSILGQIQFNNPNENASSINKKHSDNLSMVIDSLLVVAANNSSIEAYNSLQAFEFYINGQLEENQKQFLDRIFGKYDKTEEIKKGFNSELNEINEEEEIEEVGDEDLDEEEQNKEEEEKKKLSLLNERVFPELNNIELKIRVSKKTKKFIITENNKRLSKNLQLYFGLDSIAFDTLEDARNVLQGLEKSEDVDNKVFYLKNNESLQNDQTVYDNSGRAYIVKTTLPYFILNKEIVAVDALNRRSQILTEDGFIKNFSKEKRKKDYPNKLSTVDNNVVLIPRSYNVDPNTKKRIPAVIPQETYAAVMSYLGKSYEKDEANLFEINISSLEPTDKLRPVQPNISEDAHPHMFYKGVPYSISLSLTPEGLSLINTELQNKKIEVLSSPVIAFLNTNNIVFKDTNGIEINPLEMTFDQAQMFFQKLDNNKYERLIDNFASNKALEYGIKDYFENNNVTSVKFTEEEFIKQFDISFLTAIQEFDYNSNNPIELNQVMFSKVEGQYFITRNVLDKDFNVVIDMEVPGNPELDQSLLTRIEKASEEYKFQQGYIAWSFAPNGDLIYIPLKSKVLEDEKIESIFKSIQETSNKVKENQSVDLDKFNTEKDYFISMPKGFYLNITVVEDTGNVLFTLKKKEFNGQETKTVFQDTLTFTNEQITQLSIDNLQQIFDYFNVQIKDKLDDTIAENFTLTKEQFRVNFSKDSTNEEIAGDVKTDLQARVYKRKNYKIQASTEAIEQIKNPPVNTNNNNNSNANNQNSNKSDLDKKIEEINYIREGAKLLIDSTKLANVVRQSNIQNTKEGLENIVKFLNNTFSDTYKLIEFDGNQLTLSRNGIEFKIPFSENKLGGGAIYVFDFNINDIIDAKYNAEIAALTLNNNNPEFSRDDLENQLRELEDQEQKKRNEINKLKRKLKKQTDQNKINSITQKINELEAEELQLDKKISEINKQLNEIIGKVINKSHTKYSVEDIDTFINWLKDNLPSFITVEDIDTLKDNMLRGGKRVGGFMMDIRKIAGKIKSGGVIFTKDANPGKYHEAFHAVFRLLLTNEEIRNYLQIAEKEVREKLRKEGKTLDQELELFKNIDIRFDTYSKKQLKERYLEEYMADEFDLFKSNPRSTKTNSFIKSLFNRIVEIIKNVLSYFRKSDNVAYNNLNELFMAIDSGKYKSANLMDNRFTETFSPGTSEIINTLVPYKKRSGGELVYLDSDTSDALVNQIYARVLVQQENRPGVTIDELMDESIEKFNDLYERQIEDLEENDPENKKISRYNNVLEALDNFRKDIKININERLKYINLTQENIDNAEDDSLYEIGENTSNYGLKQEMIGAEKSMPNFVRKYFASTTMEKRDMFGNTYLTEDTIDENGDIVKGEKIVSTPNVAEAYNGFLRATSDIFNHSEMLTKLVVFTESSNFESKAIIDRLLKDVGMTREQILQDGIDEGSFIALSLDNVSKKPYLLHRVLKSFENSMFTYNMSVYDKNTNQSYTYNPMTYSARTAQIERWSIGNVAAIKKPEAENFTKVKKARTIFQNKKVRTDQSLLEDSRLIAELIEDGVGISLSPLYIQYSIAKSQAHTIKQRYLRNAFDKRDPITISDLEQLSFFAFTGNAIFVKDAEKDISKIYRRLAYNNIAFDETIGTTTFLNPENERIYAHQLPTFNAKFAKDLNENYLDFLNYLVENDSILEYNHLVNQEDFIEFVENGGFKYERIGGYSIKESSEDSSSGSFINKGKSYGKLTMEEFLTILLMNYTSNITGSGRFSDSKIPASPIFTRVAETSRTGPEFQMPIYKAIEEDSSITDKAIYDFYNYIKGEFLRIQKESAENANTKLINKYNAIISDVTGELVRDENKEGTAFRLYKTSAVLNNNLVQVEKIENPATDKLVYDVISKSPKGQVTISKTSELANSLERDENFANKIKIKKEENQQEIDYKRTYLIYVGESKDGYIFDYDNNYDEYIDKSITDKIERLALDPENQGRDFEEIMSEEFTDNLENIFDPLNPKTKISVPAFVREKLEAEFEKFKSILQDENINYLNPESELYNIINGTLVDQERLDSSNIEYNKLVNQNAEKSRKVLNLKNNLSNIRNSNITIDHNLKQIFFNHYFNNFALNQLLLGDHAKLFDSYQKEIKRGKAGESAGASAYSELFDSKLGVHEPVKEFDMLVFNEPKNESSLTGEKLDEADGQLYMTVKAFRYFWFGIAKLSPNQAALLDKIEKGEKLTAEEIWGTLKGGYRSGGAVKNGEMLNPKKLVYNDAEVMVKMSAYVLRKEDTSEKFNNTWVAKPHKLLLHNLREKLEKHEKEHGAPTVAAPLSAVKKMQASVNGLLRMISNDQQDSDLGVMKLDAKYFLQQQVNPSNKTIITDPTQITFLLENEQDDNHVVLINGEEFKISEIKESFEKNKSDILKFNYANKKALMFDEAIGEFKKFKKTSEMTPNLLSFLRYAEESLKSSNSSSEILQYFNLSEDAYRTGLLNNPISIKKYEELLLSYFSKSILKQKIPGSQYTMRSDFGDRVYRRVYSYREIELNGKAYYIPDKQEVIREEVALKEIRNSYQLHIDLDPGTNTISDNAGSDRNLKGLKSLIDKDTKNEGVIIIDRLRYDMTEYTYENINDLDSWTPTGEKYTEAITAIIDPEVYEKLQIVKKTSMQLEQGFKQWISLKNYPTKGGLLIARKDKKKYNEEKERINYAKQENAWYDKKNKMFVPKGFEKIPDVLAKLFALRIPTQDKHSALAVKIVDFMSATNGSTITTAREIVEVSGADFDIDKLFAQFKEFVYDKETKNFVEVGIRPGEEFYDYIKVINKKVNTPGTIFFEAYEKYKLGNGFPSTISYTDKQIKIAKKIGFNEKAFKALVMLDLPTTLEDFNQYYIDNEKTYPFDSINQNKVLDAKYALVGNTAITSKSKLYLAPDGTLSRTKEDDSYKEIEVELPAVAYQPATMDALKESLEDFKRKFPDWAKTVIDDIFDNDTLTGLMLAYRNNQVGSRLIGASVLPNTYLPKLGTLGISINENFALDINGITFNKFGSILEMKSDGAFGRRSQDNMSALITAMTDNATEQYAGKFNININSLGILSNMVMLGVPLQTGLMMIINPEILNLYKISTGGRQFKENLSGLMQRINNYFEENTITTVSNISNSQLEYLVNSDMNAEDILDDIDNINENKIEYLKNLYSLLQNYQKGNNLADYNYSLGTLFSLQKGVSDVDSMTKIDEAIDNLGLEKDSKKLDPKEHPFDAKKLFVDKSMPLNKIVRTYYDIYKDIKNDILPNVVMTQTKMFKDLFQSIISKDVIGFITRDGKKKLKYDLAAYAQIKAYMQYVFENKQGTSYSNLTNNLIYPFDQYGDSNADSITTIYDEIVDKNPDLENNFFVYQFVRPIIADPNINTYDIHMLANNMMSKIPDHKKRDVIDDFVKLYKNNKTKSLAVQIFNYLLVKDGLQYSRDSIMQALAPIVMQDFTEVVGETFERFKDGPVDIDGMFNEFITNYFMSSNIYFNPNFGIKKRKEVESISNADLYSAEYNNDRIEFIDTDRNDIYVINPYGINQTSGFITRNMFDKTQSEIDFAVKKLYPSKEKGVGFFKAGGKSIQFKFPAIIQVENIVEGEKVIQSYKLTSLVSQNKTEQVINVDNRSYLGYYAEYTPVQPEGSKLQWGGGFVFGERPSFEQLKAFSGSEGIQNTQEDTTSKFDFSVDDVVFDKQEFDVEKEELLKLFKDNLRGKIFSYNEPTYVKYVNDKMKALNVNFKSFDDFVKFMIKFRKDSDFDTASMKEFYNCNGLGFLGNLPF